MKRLDDYFCKADHQGSGQEGFETLMEGMGYRQIPTAKDFGPIIYQVNRPDVLETAATLPIVIQGSDSSGGMTHSIVTILSDKYYFTFAQQTQERIRAFYQEKGWELDKD